MTTEILDTSAAEGLALQFVKTIIGFPRSRSYELRAIGPQYEPYGQLISLDEPNLSFVVVPPGAIFADYVIEIPDVDCELLGLADGRDAAVLAIVRRKNVPVPVVNLMAPIIVNRRLGLAGQVILEDLGYGLMVPVDASSARPCRDGAPGDLVLVPPPG